MHDFLAYAPFLALGFAAGALTAYLILKARMSAEFGKEKAVLEERVSAKEELVRQLEAKFSDTFKALSSEALRDSNQSFLELAKTAFERLQEGAKGDLEKRQQSIEQLVKPVGESLKKFDEQLKLVEKERVGAYESLRQQLKSLSETQLMLKGETSNLVRALSSPKVRGRWGEMQLKRVVELAGMLDHCDFYEQQTASDGENVLRPDMIVRLPGGKNVVVDAKAPLEAYMKAVESQDDETRKLRLADHARQIRDHIRKLGQKSYWEQFEPAPEFAVLFLPGEMMFGAALEHDPSLVEQGVSERVILATPTTLIALLKAVAYGWRQENVAENARAVCELGKELYDRISTLSGHVSSIGRSLEKAVESYNKGVASLEARVLVSARKFKELKVSPEGDEIEPPKQIETQARQLQSTELSSSSSASVR